MKQGMEFNAKDFHKKRSRRNDLSESSSSQEQSTSPTVGEVSQQDARYQNTIEKNAKRTKVTVSEDVKDDPFDSTDPTRRQTLKILAMVSGVLGLVGGVFSWNWKSIQKKGKKERNPKLDYDELKALEKRLQPYLKFAETNRNFSPEQEVEIRDLLDEIIASLYMTNAHAPVDCRAQISDLVLIDELPLFRNLCAAAQHQEAKDLCASVSPKDADTLSEVEKGMKQFFANINEDQKSSGNKWREYIDRNLTPHRQALRFSLLIGNQQTTDTSVYRNTNRETKGLLIHNFQNLFEIYLRQLTELSNYVSSEDHPLAYLDIVNNTLCEMANCAERIGHLRTNGEKTLGIWDILRRKGSDNRNPERFSQILSKVQSVKNTDRTIYDVQSEIFRTIADPLQSDLASTL